MHPFVLVAVVTAAAQFGSAADSCVEYKRYFHQLDYCAEPLYWSAYSISANISIAKAEAAAQAEYTSVRDNVYYDVYDLQTQAGVDKAQLADCLGYARRVACHRAIPRCDYVEGSGSEEGYTVDAPLCLGMCQTYHARCTVDSVDFLRRGMGPDYDLYTCNGVENRSTTTDQCSPGARSRGSPLSRGSMAALVALASGLLFLWGGGQWPEGRGL